MKLNQVKNSIILIGLLGFITSVICKEKTEGLYSPKGSVFILDQNNFHQNVLRYDSGWIVEFYNSWCGHCVKFAPTWKEFAKKHEDWWPLLRIGAVNCADELNVELCRSFQIDGIPAFKLFPPGYKGIETGGIFHDQDPEFLEHEALDFISNTSLFQPPKFWPRLDPIVSMQDIWNETKNDHHFVAFVFEEPGSYVGRQIDYLKNIQANAVTHLSVLVLASLRLSFFLQAGISITTEGNGLKLHIRAHVIMDTFGYKPLLVRRMLKESVKKFGILKFPSLFLINRDGTFTRLSKNDNTRDGMVSALKNLLSPTQLEAGEKFLNQRPRNQPTDSKIEGEPAADINSKVIRPAVYMKDLESTLHYALRQEIAICRIIDGEKLTALKTFMNVLSKYFPGREEVSNYLFRISAWLKTTSTEITGDQWITMLDEKQTMEEYLPENIKWVGCQGSEPQFRGYPCGMWTLFHTLTVAGFQKEHANPKDIPLDILGAIKGYMKFFFGCQICVQHFLKMADKITPADKTPEGAVMWLWRAHNLANSRLHGDQSEDPKHPKIQFPSKQLCPECRHGEKWNDANVLEFLLSFYGRVNIVPVADDNKNDSAEKTTAANEKKKLDWWELQQRKNDLEKIRSLRFQKLEKRQQKKVENLAKISVIDKNSDLHYRHQSRKNPLSMNDESKSVISGWGFSNLDMSMCVTFYVLCTLMILVLYYHFIVRRKYRPCSVFC